MKSFKIISDSSCDLPLEQIMALDVGFVPFYVSFDGTNYKKEKTELYIDDFYQTLNTNHDIFPKTSLPGMQDYLDNFRKYIEEGYDKLICVCLSSGLSGAYQAAVNAKNIALDDFPNAEILVLDSVNATIGQGLLVLELVKMRDDGLNFNEASEKLKEIRSQGAIYFTVDSLEYLQKGGRVGRWAAFAGELLNIKPILKVTNEGKLAPVGKVRGKKKSMNEIIDLILNDTKDKKDDYVFSSLYAGFNSEDAILLQRTLEKDHGYTFVQDQPFRVGVTIGAHTGPTAIAIGYMKKYK